MQKPKIIVCATAYHPHVGGAEIAIQKVAERLSGSFDFFVMTARHSRGLPRRERRGEATVIRLGFGTRFDKWLLPFLIPFYFFRHLKKFSGMLLWGMDISQGSLGAAFVKLARPRVPFVLTVQYGESPEYLARGRAGFIRRGFHMMLARADRVTAISSYLLARVRAEDYCGPADIIPNGVDTERFANGKWQMANDDADTPLAISHKPNTIITVSRLVRKNGIDILIDAIAETKKTIPDVRCVIVGDGPERKNIESRIRNHGLRQSIKMLGEIAHEKLPERLAGADVFVRPSRSEGMGNAFAEAMAAGLPVIGTAVGGIPDVITHEETGLLAEAENAEDLARQIVRMLTDTDLARRLAAAGEERVRAAFAWEGIARQYERVFGEELGVSRRVVIATGLFPPEIGGPATYVSLLVDALPARGIGLRVVPFRSVRGLPKILRHAAYFWKIIWAARGSDIVFAQDPVSTGFPSYCAAFLLRKKFLLKVVGDYAWEQYCQRHTAADLLEEFQGRTYDLATEVRRWIEQRVSRWATLVIVPSGYLKGIVSQWGVPATRLKVIYNAFIMSVPDISQDEARSALHISRTSFVVVSAGRLVPWKGFTSLIDAMLIVREKIPSVRLYIVGSGPEETRLKKRIEAGALEQTVFLTGGVSHDVMARYFIAGNLFILNSSYEGFSHTLLEAMAAGIPVVAYAIGGNKEIIGDTGHALLYAANDAHTVAATIIQLHEHSALRTTTAQRGREIVHRFDKATMIEKTCNTLLMV